MIKREIGRPVAAAIILFALLCVAGLTLVMAWADLSSAEEELQAKTDFTARGVRTVQRGSGQGAEAPPARLHVEADSETLAAAQIDALVRSTSAEAGGSVLSSRADAKHDEAGIAGRVEIVVEIEAPNEILQDILFRLETGAPLLLVDSLSIQPAASREAAADDAPRLHADVTLSAYWNDPKR